jgi:hypothetical protein
MGKTSLMVRTAFALRASGVRAVVIDLTALGTRITAEQWYLGQVMRIAGDAGLKVDYLGWWQQHDHLGCVQRFVTFLVDIVLGESAEPIVIFVDEIDTTLNLTFSDDYFAAIRSLYNLRATNSALMRLTFVLMGVASPSDLIQDAKRTPFNIGVRIPLTDFSETEASVLLPALAPDTSSATQLLRQVLFWTGGHPYLTQKTCESVADWAGSSGWDVQEVPFAVDHLVRELFFSERGRNQDFNLQFVRDRILKSDDSGSLLQLYGRIRNHETVTDDELDPIRTALKLSGLVVANEERLLQVRNRIYDRVFDDIWVTSEAKKHPSDSRPTSLLGRFSGWLGGGLHGSQKFKYDAFLSYSSRDREWVSSFLVPHLRAAGVSLFSETTIRRIELQGTVDAGFTQSRCIILVMTPDYFASYYAQFEVEKALRLLDDPATANRVIPLLVRSADLPSPLRRLRYIDFRENKSGAAIQLLEALGVEAVDAGKGNIVDYEFAQATPKSYDTAIIRRLLDEALDEDDLDAFVYDHFRAIRGGLDAQNTKKAKIQSLIQTVERDGELDRLLDLMARDFPAKYRRYADLLERPAS